MNHEYLWDRSGSDPDIEGLEDLLLDYRYSPAAPPELPATNIVRVQNERPRWHFGLIFAASVSFTLLILAGVWLRGGGSPSNSAISAAASPEVTTLALPSKVAPKAAVIEEPPVTRDENKLTASSPQRHRSTRPMPARFTLISRKNREQVLTAEEKYAYGQLMLALSITSSKLKLVRHVIDNVEADRPGAVIIDK